MSTLLSQNELELLKKFSKIVDQDQLDSHLARIQRRALNVFSSSWVQRLGFARLVMKNHPLYGFILQSMRQAFRPTKRLIHIDCQFGSDLRLLLNQGCPGSNLMGVDISLPSQELGHDLFQDHHTCPIRFVSYDILNNNVLSTGHGHIATSVDKELKGRFSFVCINSLHTYSRRDQERMVSKLALIVAPGGYVFGQTVGIARSDLDSNYEEEGGEDGTRHSMHTVDSFKILLTSSGFEDGDVVVNVSDDDNRTHLLHLPGTDHATVPEYATVLNFSAKAK